MLPTDPPADIERAMRMIAGDSVNVIVSYGAEPSDPSPLRPELMALLDQLATRYFPGAPVIPDMAAGSSDALYLRNAGIPTYNPSALAEVDGEANAHGLNEKVREKSVYDAVAFWYEMVKGLASGGVRI
jgi:acetylornithine deacetylase/succinyl-diaminopimelate desuccinylase-like protein